jgi:hypothetical protein
MPQFIDMYVFTPSRSRKLVNNFLAAFFSKTEEAAGEYVINLGEGKFHEFAHVGDIMKFLETNENRAYSIYWRSADELEESRLGMVFYQDDGGMVIGISTPGNDPEHPDAVALYKKLRGYLNATLGCITVEEAPPSNSIEFQKFCLKRYAPS